MAIVLVIGSIVLALYFIYFKPFLDKIQQQAQYTIDPQLVIYTGGGGNSGVLVDDSTVLVIDTKIAGFEKAFYDSVMRKAAKRKVMVVNTHWHPDHVAGNYLFDKNSIWAGGNYSNEAWKNEVGESTLPGNWIKDKIQLAIAGDTALIINLAKNVHTASDVIIYLKNRKVLFAGDVILNQQAPALFGPADAYAYIAVMKELQAKYEIKTVVPGHGPVGGPEVISNFITFFNDMEEAAKNPEKESELVKKYDNWNQIPFAMSPGATISHFKNKAK